MTTLLPLPHRQCPLCGGPNACEPARTGRFDTPCWCVGAVIDPSVLARIPEAARKNACICPRCAGRMTAPAGD